MSKITLNEPYGPLRTGLLELKNTLEELGGQLFDMLLNLANKVLEIAIDLEKINLCDTDQCIPKTYFSLMIKRKRKEFNKNQDSLTEMKHNQSLVMGKL